MRIVLLWRRDRGPAAGFEPRAVAERLQAVLGPLVAAPPEIALEEERAAAMVFAQLPVAGWRTPFAQEDGSGRAYAVDYPIGVGRLLAATGAKAPERDGELPALVRQLAADPLPLLRELPPPFSLVWWPAGGQEAVVQTDGLGRAQLLEYDDGARWAVTNKVAALSGASTTRRSSPTAARSTAGSSRSWGSTARSPAAPTSGGPAPGRRPARTSTRTGSSRA